MSQFDILQQRATYQFRTGSKGPFEFQISNTVSDFGQFQSRSQMKDFYNNFLLFSRLWLEKKGWKPVSFKVVDHWDNSRADYGYNPDFQLSIRRAILADFLNPLNAGRKLQDYVGLRDEKSHYENGMNTRFYDGK
jgi:hypothetical protein